MSDWQKWPERIVVEVRRPGLGNIHFFVLDCGHPKIEKIYNSTWCEVDKDVHPNWFRPCSVCYAEQMHEQESKRGPRITTEYVESLLEHIDLG